MKSKKNNFSAFQPLALKQNSRDSTCKKLAMTCHSISLHATWFYSSCVPFPGFQRPFLFFPLKCHPVFYRHVAHIHLLVLFRLRYKTCLDTTSETCSQSLHVLIDKDAAMLVKVLEKERRMGVSCSVAFVLSKKREKVMKSARE